MTKLKEQAAELINDIPEDVIVPLIEILKRLREVYTQNSETGYGSQNMWLMRNQNFEVA